MKGKEGFSVTQWHKSKIKSKFPKNLRRTSLTNTNSFELLKNAIHSQKITVFLHIRNNCKMKIPIHKIENFSDAHRLNVRSIPILKKRNYFVDNTKTIDGDAPKKFIGIYNYPLPDNKHRKNRKNWIYYIAKTGHKWYPSESITEMLMNRLGVIFGLKMADSQIMMIGGQLRFLSKYFLNPLEELVHGADILAGYLNVSNRFVEEVDKLKLTRDLFTLQFIEEAVANQFPCQKDYILHELSKLIVFDALVGNNDRHFFNWGVIRSIENNYQPYFSPIYDTARGLFWNYSENKIFEIVEVNKNMNIHIQRYCKNSHPKIGWENENKLNHFRLFEKIYTNEFYISKNEIKAILTPGLLERMTKEVKQKFRSLMTINRITMICKCLEYRFNEMRKIL